MMRLLDIGAAAERKIDYIKVGRLIRFDPSALDTWIEANTIMAVTP